MKLQLIGTGMTIIGCDANVHFSSPHDGSVGAYGLEAKESYSAPYFAELLQDFSLWIPATFAGCHHGPRGTWKHPVYGTWHCNDYVAISHCLQASGCQSWVDGTLDAGGSGIDHLAALLQGVLYKSGKNIGVGRRNPESIPWHFGMQNLLNLQRHWRNSQFIPGK